jgi:hypothetical protein
MKTAPPPAEEALQEELRCGIERILSCLAGHEQAGDWPTTLRHLSEVFSLSEFEQAVLMACAAFELDGRFAAEFAQITVGLALEKLPDANWAAFAPDAALRLWGLIEIEAQRSISQAVIRIEESVLQLLLGNPSMDSRLVRRLRGLDAIGVCGLRQAEAVEQVVRFWKRSTGLVQIVGPEPGASEAVASAAAEKVGLMLLRCLELPEDPRERAEFVWLWNRHTLLVGGVLLLEAEEGGAIRIAQGLFGPTLLLARDRCPGLKRPSGVVEVDLPSEAERRQLWAETPVADDPELPLVAHQFQLGPDQIHQAAIEASAGKDLWSCARLQNRGRLDELAERVQVEVCWESLVVDEDVGASLHELVSQARNAREVHGAWGFGTAQGRGLGISALFSGPSGTGKTLAAEVIANELRMDLYRIDLSRVVSKYIGETEKHLRRIFDAAERGGVVLLFDEADALFGKRSEVRDSHDRYANIEVSYLLQRIEQYRGLAILTTNLRSSFDPAFLRRLRFLVQFPFPDSAQRQKIWEVAFPGSTPTTDLDCTRLAQLNVAGGSIRNIAIGAAFLAAEQGTAVGMEHLLASARAEYSKLERLLTDAEVEGWT